MWDLFDAFMRVNIPYGHLHAIKYFDVLLPSQLMSLRRHHVSLVAHPRVNIWFVCNNVQSKYIQSPLSHMIIALLPIGP